MKKSDFLTTTVKGVALVQVLFLTAILSLMALHFTLTSRQQVNIALSLQDKVNAELLLVSWQNELLYALLTQPTSGMGNELAGPSKIAKLWNFYGKAFSPVEGVTIKIQDLYGLLSLSTPGAQHELKAMLSAVSVSESDMQRIIVSLDEWQGIDSEVYQQRQSSNGRNMFMQNLSEFSLMPGISERQYAQLSGAVTSLPNVTFNPLTAPDFRLKAILPAGIAKKLIDLRESGQLDAATYIALTGITDYEALSFVPGQRFIIDVSATSGGAVAKRRFICYIRPENQFPLIWLD